MGVMFGMFAIVYIVCPLLLFLKVAGSSRMEGKTKTRALALLTVGYVLTTACLFLVLDGWITEELDRSLQAELAKNGIRNRPVSSPMVFWYNPYLM
jgi:cytochrome bd-type quinol oxidase subunit 1